MNTAAKPFYERVDGEQVQGWVADDRRSFRAWGIFRGREIVTRGRSDSHAIDLWAQAANRIANE